MCEAHLFQSLTSGYFGESKDKSPEKESSVIMGISFFFVSGNLSIIYANINVLFFSKQFFHAQEFFFVAHDFLGGLATFGLLLGALVTVGLTGPFCQAAQLIAVFP